ncbi:conserved hypothetical protein [Methanococcus vannielii SB]|uniref:Dinitrogenase iron-molybdenum cofactor biosynthesis domain-containing protein n=1 Tax=Methanococcus vannielii (strain ATCC 35089 / DSM 1224 / JCM 13029 / OCM 148 / SB) TaxID=406327 RepID=A6US56_METVS|nr:NifB/NifX family molybdenum-iron cluster-binding protein [Methanococcus vannielii]ABR55328.1 conserved hypothetical protein [Methanococcus vannielii SB]
MKICVTSTGNSFESGFEQKFGRSPYFIIYDTETKEFETLDNLKRDSAHGAGIGASQAVLSKGINVVISGNIGPNVKIEV